MVPDAASSDTAAYNQEEMHVVVWFLQVLKAPSRKSSPENASPSAATVVVAPAGVFSKLPFSHAS